MADVTVMLERLADGDARAADELTPLVYDQLRALARDFMARERPDHTLQATALVNEAYLRMIDQTRVRWTDRAHFFAVAATMIRRVLVDHARAKGRSKRGGDWTRVSIDAQVDWSGQRNLDLLALDDALTRLAQIDDRQSRIVQLRFFGGLTIAQTADVLGVSTTTVEQDWAHARAWLRREIGNEP